jgi:hypothetical protein
MRMPSFRDQLWLYVAFVGLKITMGATAWMISLYCIFDKFISPNPISDLNYVFRNIVAGSADAFFVGIGDLICTRIKKGNWKEHSWKATRELMLGVFVVGGLWYPECDLAYYISHGKVDLDNDPEFSAAEILANLLVYLICHQLIFKLVVRLQRAAWADHVIDFQMAVGGFFFYISYVFPISDLFLASLAAGAFTGLCAAISGAIVVFIRWTSGRKKLKGNFTVELLEERESVVELLEERESVVKSDGDCGPAMSSSLHYFQEDVKGTTPVSSPSVDTIPMERNKIRNL